jgi:uncharacterized membrane protein YfcA
MIHLVIGLVAGVLSGLFGIGGGIVIVPMLIITQGFKPQLATGTSLAALLLPVGALGAWQYWKSGDVNLKAAAFIALGLATGAYFGARIGVPLPPRVMQRSFAVFLVGVAGLLWWRTR